MDQDLIVNEIYRTIQGEGVRAGRPCTIIRLSGCNLRCNWCDTAYAYGQGRRMTVREVLAEVKRLGRGLSLVTGGEPMLQGQTPELLRCLCQAGCDVLLETNGSLDIGSLDRRVARCVDVKCPGSGQAGSFLRENLNHLREDDEAKFVLADRNDYEFARRFVLAENLAEKCEVIFTPAGGTVSPAELAEWIIADRIEVRLGLQLHKIIWPGSDRGV